MTRICLWIGFLAAAAPAFGGTDPDSGLPVTLPDGTVIQAEVARTPEEQQLGLMLRGSLPEGRGMLFVFDRTGEHPFWMKNTLIPLDILWMDEDRRIIHIEHAVPPCRRDPCPVINPGLPARFVLEINAGAAARHGLRTGQKLRF